MDIGIGAIAEAAKYLDQQLGIIQAVKNKLVRQPEEAAEKLVIALDEIAKIYGAIDQELARYLSLFFKDNKDWRDDRQSLVQLEGSNLRPKMEEARGHCHKIGNIHEQYLRRWYDHVLNTKEASDLNSIFEWLSTADNAMIQQIEILVNWLAPAAESTLNLVDGGKLTEADAKLHQDRKEALPTRQVISETIAQLRRLQAEFIDVAGIT